MRAVEVAAAVASAVRRRRAVRSVESLVAAESPRGAERMGWVEKGEEARGRAGLVRNPRLKHIVRPGSGKWRLSAPNVSIFGKLFPRSLRACVMLPMHSRLRRPLQMAELLAHKTWYVAFLWSMLNTRCAYLRSIIPIDSAESSSISGRSALMLHGMSFGRLSRSFCRL